MMLATELTRVTTIGALAIAAFADFPGATSLAAGVVGAVIGLFRSCYRCSPPARLLRRAVMLLMLQVRLCF
jgi:hypothetical protein